ncbi:uncharacterized protein LOC129956869 isoform X2 [Argiope bruennichi]|uniref:uncharacterized protein LOC129956869 isoform X2 n=1 Tax=Argiope bruennichi TaxID=94029 RepID=UPI002494392E|nr:uncharacterized protein LOC129956869 isoform X2 [Argiope bruennichi]
MAQEAMTNMHMTRRCEPMGGEIDSNNRNAPSVINISSQSNFTDSPPEENFIDDLTLRVRSLLKSWEDDISNDDSFNNHEMQDNSCNSHSALSKKFHVEKSAVPLSTDFSSNKIVQEFQNSNELKCHCDVSKFNPSGNFAENSPNDCKTSDFSSFTHQIGLKASTNSRENIREEIKKCVPPLIEGKSSNRSEFKNEKYLNHSRISVSKNSNYEMDDTIQSLRKTSTPKQTIEDALSYNDFSNSLQDVRNISNAKEKNFNVPIEQTIFESPRKLSVHEQNSKQAIKNSKSNSLLNVATSTDFHSRESSDKETERSWSEITVVAESYSEPSRHPITLSMENQNDFCNVSASQPVSFGEPPKVFNSNPRVKENIKNLSRSTDIYNKDIKLDSRDWRIEITDHDKTSQASDKEYQFSDFLPNSNLSDLDQIDHDTPPLSASSMASSKRLEWDNGADIGYNVATMRSKVKYRSIPRSEPEGISFINETGANTASSKIMLPSFASVSSQDEPASVASSHLNGNSCETSSVHDPSVMEDVLERSSSPGSLSRSDSKKSVIYNSYKNSFAADKVCTSSDHSFIQAPKNSSWPDLTLKTSVLAADWQAISPSKMLSKSDEQVGLVRHSKLTTKLELSRSPDFTASGNNIYKSTDLTHLPERILPIGDYFPSESQSVPKNNSARNISHSCKNCQSVINENVSSSATDLNNQKCGDLYNLQEGDLESFEIDSESPNVNQINNSSQFPHHDAEGDWMNESAHDSDFSYITELPELADYQLQSFNSRPFLLLSQDSSRFKGSNFPNIVQNLLRNSNSIDHSINGNLEVKPHIRWYPLPSTSNFQDIKNVSTQTADSFIAKKQTDSLIQVTDPQVNYEELSNETSGLKLGAESTDKFSIKTMDNSSSLSTSILSKASAVISKGTSKSQSSLNERTNNSFSHHIYVPSGVPMTANKSTYSNVNQAEGKLHLSKLSNSSEKNMPLAESCLSHKSEVEKHGEMSSLTHLASPVVTSNKSAQYQPSTAFNDTRYNGNDSSYFGTRNAVSYQPSKDYSSSLVKRRVGVGQCHTSSESITDKVTRENFRIQPGMLSKESRNSSTGNLMNKNAGKDEPGPHSSEVSDANYSSSVFSRFISNQLGDESANSDLTESNYRQDLDNTIPLASAYNRNYVETTSDRCNSSSTIPLESIHLNPNEKVNSSVTDYERKCSDMTSDNTNHFMQRETNLSQLLSENPPFCISKQHQNKIVHKSHSDPLISSRNFKTNVACEEIKTLPQSRMPPVNRKLDFELSSNSDTDSCERIDCVETSSLNYSNTKDTPGFHQPQNLLRETASNSFLFNRGSFNSKNPFQDIENIPQSSNLSTEIPKYISDSHKYFFKEQTQLPSRNEMEKSKNIQKQFEHLDVVDEVHQIPRDNVLSRSMNFDVNKKNYASVGVQVSQNISKLEKCSFCHKTKDSHMNCCLKKEIFKTVLNETLAKRISTTKSKYATSFCVYPSGCYCCCNKTLQEAFNFHRSEIVERIEHRKKEVEEKCKKKLFLHAPQPSQTKFKQTNVKLSLKPATDVNRKTGKMNVNKENKRNKRSETSSWKNASSQMGRQKNLNKYNRIMSKIYSQRLKNETLKGNVNHRRHETLINS